MPVTCSLKIPKELVEPYPSVELKSTVAKWCKAIFKNPFDVIRAVEKRHDANTNIDYWVWGAELRGSVLDMTTFRLRFTGKDADSILEMIQADLHDWVP